PPPRPCVGWTIWPCGTARPPAPSCAISSAPTPWRSCPSAPPPPWRRAPPGLEVITRDRSHASAEGARQGAPTALPVADRCPLLQHRAAALEQGCTTQHPVLAAVHAAVRQQPGALAAGP